uniref:Retrovirus-related Pol polyprotein from transposon TNT 1-94 n=1 Tax=Cajanus cajan TaxID=3821 RepID=A0A151U7C6_CAJCA|nr:Retrovirus-related Pol polyprotein from transposon TNT 1-94 [Cajanus cajan]
MLSVEIVSRYMEEPRYSHWKAVKRILRYIKGTQSYGLMFTKSDSFQLVGYSDSDWSGDIDDRRTASWTVQHATWLRNLLKELEISK